MERRVRSLRWIWLAVLIVAGGVGTLVAMGPGRLLNRYAPHAPAPPEQWAPAYAYEPGEIAAFAFDRGRERPLFEGEINGRKMVLFFDSANAFGLTVPVGWVREEGWKVTGESRHVVGGEAIGSFPDFGVFSFSVAGFALPLEKGTSSSTSEASFGWTALEGRRITLDYEHGRVGISPSPLRSMGTGLSRSSFQPKEGTQARPLE